MGLISKTAIVKWGVRNKKYYEEKGYVFTKMGDKFEVKVEDLTDYSRVCVDVQCDECGEILKDIIWGNYKTYIHKDGTYYCHDCSNRLFGRKKTAKTKLLSGQSFYDWCYRNLSKKQADEIMNRWDYELNGCSPKEVTYSSSGVNGKGYWFKCSRSLHSSELKNIGNFVQGHDRSIDCKTCDSIGQYIIDLYGKETLNKYWDYEKNNALGLYPFKISKSSNIKIWIKCQEKEYHGSYDISSNHFVQGRRCPYCTNHCGKVHPLDSLGQYIIDNYGQDFIDKIWSEKNEKSAFNYSPHSAKEVWWKCFDGKHEDYKRQISTSSTHSFRCPECSREKEESYLQEKVRLYLNELGYDILHERNCSIIPQNPKTNFQLPYDNEITLFNGKHLIIEVMGKQHYEICSWHKSLAKKHNTTSKYEIHMIQVRDRYKRMFAKKQRYEYLVIPYWFEKKEQYKKLINNKIREILDIESR